MKLKEIRERKEVKQEKRNNISSTSHNNNSVINISPE